MTQERTDARLLLMLQLLANTVPVTVSRLQLDVSLHAILLNKLLTPGLISWYILVTILIQSETVR